MKKDLTTFGFLSGLFQGLLGLIFRSMLNDSEKESFMTGWLIGIFIHVLVCIVLYIFIKASISNYLQEIVKNSKF